MVREDDQMRGGEEREHAQPSDAAPKPQAARYGYYCRLCGRDYETPGGALRCDCE